MTYRRRKRRRRVTPQAAVSWLWEFSKKVVWTVTLLYIVSFVFAMVLCWRELQFIGNTAAITTLITESNETFRVVVGGYLIKMPARLLPVSKRRRKKQTITQRGKVVIWALSWKISEL